MKNVRAKKHLGQHFLNDKQIAFNITDLLSDGAQNVVEIGPGMGILTQFLIKKDFTTEVVEIDTESVFYLRLNYPQLADKITEGDFLQLNLKERYPYNCSLIGNFPYNISSQILFKAFENRDQIPEVIGMFQKEVAERVACKKGKKRGILSVFLQAFYDIEYCFSINEDVFTPPPKVKSERVVKAGFNQRRKTLRNALKPFILINESEIANLLTLRAEQLSVDDFIKLTNHVG